jgi:NodT family efflux transporter outer membrane factor (OMF) lipoprotein
MTSRLHRQRGPGRSLRIGLILVALSALLSACMVGPDFTPPKAPTTKAYSAEGEAELQNADPTKNPEVEQRLALGKKISADWWTLLHSRALDDVIRRAIAGNLTLAASRATLLQAQEAVRAAGGALYPQVDLATRVAREKFGASFLGPNADSSPAFTSYLAGPSVSYNLDLFGGIRRNIEQQQALAEYQGYQLEAAYLSITGNVVIQAIRMASLRAQLQTIEDILADDRRNLALVQAAFRNGAVTQVDVLSAQSQLANDRTLRPPLRQQLSVARHALSILAGAAPGDWRPPDFDLSELTLPQELPVTLPSELVHARPDIRAAEARLHAASAAIGVATANMYPNINLSASLTQEATDPGQLFTAGATAWSLVSGLTQPLFHGGELKAQRRGAVDAFQATLATYQQTVLQSFGQVADVLQALAHDGQELAAQKHALDSAEASLRLTRLSYSAGNVGVLQVLDAERLYQRARLGYVQAQAQRYLDTAELFLAMGGGTLGQAMSPAAAARAGGPEPTPALARDGQ